MPTGTQFTDDDDNDFDGDESALIRDLRKQLKDARKRETQMEQQLSQLSTQARERTLQEALTAKGLNVKAAKFYPSDAELTDEAITAWVGENADIFGVAPSTTDDPGTDPGQGTNADEQPPGEQFTVDPATEAAYRRLHAAQLVGGTGTTREQDLLRSIAQAKDADALTAVLRTARA